MGDNQVAQLIIWLLVGCAAAAALWALSRGRRSRRPTEGATAENAVVAGAPPEGADDADDLAPDYPKPLGFEARAAMASRLSRRKPSVYNGLNQAQGAAPPTNDANASRILQEQALGQLTSLLNDSWSIFRNINLPGELRVIDLVLVGPAGVMVFEVKSMAGARKLENGNWFLQLANGQWVAQTEPLGTQARDDAKRLDEFLRAKGLQRNNEARAILLLGQNDTDTPLLSSVEVWQAEDLATYTAPLLFIQQLSTFRANRVVSTLEDALIDRVAIG